MSVTIVCHGPDCPRRMSMSYPMKPIDETHTHVVYECQTCFNVRTVSKHKVGGTIGAGRTEKEPALKYLGRGF